MMHRSPYIVALTLVIGTGVVHGLWTDRWKASANSDACVDKFSRLPMTLGDWNGRALELDPLELERGGVVDYTARDYVNSRTKNEVQIVLMCGKTGPICAHTPDVCFEGAGYRMTGAPEKFSPTQLPTLSSLRSPAQNLASTSRWVSLRSTHPTLLVTAPSSP